MNLEEYHSIYPGEGPTETPKRPDTYLSEGMILFDDESAPAWGGPYLGNFAYYILFDERGNKNLISEEDQVAKYTESYNKNSKRKFDKNHKEFNALLTHALNESPTIEKPFRLYMTGNDDTSYSKNFPSQSEAIEFIQLLELCQPINLFRDIQPIFAFTN